MQTFIDIMYYAAMLLAGFGIASTVLVVLGVALTDHTFDPEAHH